MGECPRVLQAHWGSGATRSPMDSKWRVMWHPKIPGAQNHYKSDIKRTRKWDEWRMVGQNHTNELCHYLERWPFLWICDMSVDGLGSWGDLNSKVKYLMRVLEIGHVSRMVGFPRKGSIIGFGNIWGSHSRELPAGISNSRRDSKV